MKVLGLDWSVVHDEADSLEHAISDVVLERLDALLGHPTTDPHGDPIPTPKGQLHEQSRLSLADCTVGAPHRITRVLDQAPEFLQFVDRHGLTPGATVAVQKREAAAEAVARARWKARRDIAGPDRRGKNSGRDIPRKGAVIQMRSRPNFRFILAITVLTLVILAAVLFILIGYEQASRHAIGNFAPIGQPTNFGKTK